MDHFCLIIPCNRTEFLDNISKFYSSTKIKVKIVHNLSKDFQNNFSSNIEFIFIDKENPFMRVIDSLKKINEKYCMLFSDDDFVFEDTIKRSINFLEANADFVTSQGMLCNFDYKDLQRCNFNNLDFSIINRETDSKFKNIRLWQSFTTRYVDRIYSITKTEILLDILKSAEPLLDDYSQSMELYFICCLTLVGRDKVFMEIGWMKGQHDNNLHKKVKYLADYWIFNRKFIFLFFACLNNFSNKRKINNFSFIYLLFIFFIFKIKIIAVGYSNLSRIFFEKIRNFEKKKKIKFAQDIYFNNIVKVNNIKNFILKKRKDDY
jgi:glycosyltransferase domain-containing protein